MRSIILAFFVFAYASQLLGNTFVRSNENTLNFEINSQYLDSLYQAKEIERLLQEIDRLELASDLNLTESESLHLIFQKLRANYSQSNYIETIHYGQKYILLFDDGKLKEFAAVNMFLGNAYLYLNEYGIAMDYYIKASDLYEKLNLPVEQLTAENNIALIYDTVNDHQGALAVFNKSLITLKKTNSDRISHAYTSIARSYLSLQDYTNAKSYLDSALNKAIEMKKKGDEAYTYRNYGWLYFENKQFDKAEEYYQKSLDLHASLNAYHEVSEAALLLSDLYMSTGEYERSLEICLKYVDQAFEKNNLSLVIQYSDNMFKSYVALSEYKSAINIMSKYQSVQDSLDSHRLANVTLMTQLRSEAANEVNMLKQQDEINNQTIRFQNTLLVFSITGIVLLIVIAVIIYRSLLVNRRLSALNKKQSERLEQLDAAKSRFFANISHDLRTPLSLIMGSIEQVLQSEDVSLTNKAERQLKVGLQNGQRIIHLTNEINELIKLEDSKLKIDKKYINLDHMVSLFVSMFNSMAEMKGVKLSYTKKILDQNPVVSIDINQFEKVLFNLITNALKHTKKDDSVNVTLDILDDETVELSIVDSGEGIPEENVPYIFERYYQAPTTTYKTQEGFGIGLALVKEIIDKHGAKIEAKSKLGVGSQFSILLSLHKHVNEDQLSKLYSLEYSHDTRELFRDIDEVESNERPIVFSPSLKEDRLNKNQTILLVEDHPEVRQHIQDIIEPYYNVITADNGKRALKILDAKEVDLITTDLMMPWFDGFELLEKLREDDNLSKIPVLVVSARTSEEDKSRVLSQGINDFLHKPFKSDELLARIKNLLDRKSKWNSKDENALFINNKETLNEIEKSLLQKVDNMILERIDDPNLAVPFLASEIAVSERKFFRMIKKLTGTTPYEYIKEFRLQYVNRLIREKKISNSSEAAKHIGMNNVSHFNTQFKTRFGKKPADMI